MPLDTTRLQTKNLRHARTYQICDDNEASIVQAIDQDTQAACVLVSFAPCQGTASFVSVMKLKPAIASMTTNPALL